MDKKYPLRSKRIVFVLNSFNIGGAEKQALLLARYLQHTQKAEVQIWAFGSKGPLINICESYGVFWYRIPINLKIRYVGPLSALFILVWQLRHVRADIVLPYSSNCNVMCGLIWRWTGAKLCVWNQRNGGIAPVSSWVNRWAIRLIPWFISNSQIGAEFLTKTFNVSPEKIQVIFNGVETPIPKEDRIQWRSKLNFKEDDFLVCMIANLTKAKDHITLLKAWKQVINKTKQFNYKVFLLLAGELGETYVSLQLLTKELKLENSVLFLGRVDDIAGLLTAVDLSVFSSQSEGTPNGVLESMAMKLAVVGTNVPGICNIIGEKGKALLAPVGDFEILANNILRLIVDSELRFEIGQENHYRVKTEFDLQRMCEKTVDFLTQKL